MRRGSEIDNTDFPTEEEPIPSDNSSFEESEDSEAQPTMADIVAEKLAKSQTLVAEPAHTTHIVTAPKLPDRRGSLSPRPSSDVSLLAGLQNS